MIRIALIHSFYASGRPSGENNVVGAELRSLRAAGHDVALIAEHTDDQQTAPTYRVRAALRVATGRGRSPLDDLRTFDPDVVHVHNLFPNFGQRWVDELDVALVHTRHNFRPLCANGMLFRDGEVCTLCPDGDRWAGLRYGCYRGSRAATLPISLANRGGPAADRLLVRSDRLVFLSERQREIYRRSGTPMDRAVTWPNFLLDDLDPGPDADTPDDAAGWLFVGRISEEKGIMRLLERWPREALLRIAGDGPLLDTASEIAGPNVEVLGRVERSTVLDLMRASVGLVFPSLWFEAAPLVHVEALAAGLPVLAARPNAVAEAVERDGTGDSFTWDDDLAATLIRAEQRYPGLRDHCRSVFEERHTQAAHAERARRTYQEALTTRERRR